MASLVAIYERVTTEGQSEIVLVSGYSGIGKTSLVAELHRPVVARRGYFIAGKFDQYRRGIPYATLAQAFQSLVQQLLAESGERLDAWRRRVQEALGENAGLMTDMVPQLELLIGPQPRPAEAPPDQAQMRLRRSFERFVGAFAEAEHPLVLFLDDLQWVDSASLQLLEQLIVARRSHHLLVIGAYRDNEVGAAHPLSLMLQQLAKARAPVHGLKLEPLAETDVQAMLAEALRCTPDEARPLADLVYAKTRGNPFFCFQFLATLHQDGLLAFDAEARGWRWKLPDIEARNFTDNVVALMIGELKRLPASTQRALAIAGFIGNRFEIALLAEALDATVDDTRAALMPALQVGLIAGDAGEGRFLHDRVQEAAFLLEPAEQRATMHASIGRLLLRRTPEDALADRAQLIVAHLNAGIEAIVDPIERRRLAELNRMAGAKALAGTVFAEAAGYFATGLSLLPEGNPAPDFELMFALLLGQAEGAYLSGEQAEALRLLDRAEQEARDALERCRVTMIRVRALASVGKFAAARAVGLARLREVGFDIPDAPTRADVERANIELEGLMAGRTIESLIDLPPATDPRMQMAIHLMMVLIEPTYFCGEQAWAMHIPALVLQTLRHGRTDESALIFASFGFDLCGRRRPVDGNRYVELGLALMQRLERCAYRGRLLATRAITREWIAPHAEVLALLREAALRSTENGEMVALVICTTHLVQVPFAGGAPLDVVAAETDRVLEILRAAKLARGSVRPTQQFLRALRGETAGLQSFDSEGFDEAEFERVLYSRGTLAMVPMMFHLSKLMAHVLAGDFALAVRAADQARPLLWTVFGTLMHYQHVFHEALALAAGCDAEAPGMPLAADMLPALRSHRELLATWREANAPLFASAHALVSAELDRLEGRPLAAMAGYEQAIEAARRHGLPQNEGLAHETAARFYRRQGVASVALMHLRGAHAAYTSWGAAAKLRQLEALHPQLAGGSDPARREALESSTSSTRSHAQIDALALARAALAISSQIFRGDLLQRLLEVMLEHSAAQFGALLKAVEGGLETVAVAAVVGERIEVEIGGGPGSLPRALPQGLVTYALRSREAVAIEDARAAHGHAADPYFATGDHRSCLALPIVLQSEPVGVLYLEHHAIAGVFNPQRREVLRHLAAQAAISLENAHLYEALDEHKRDLELKVAERTGELQRSQALLQTILDSSSALVSLKGRDGRYLLHNQRFAAYFGRRGESLVGLRIDDIATPELIENALAQDRLIIENGTPMRFEDDRLVDGVPRAFQVDKFPVFDDAGRIYAIGAISVEVTQLHLARRSAEEATRAKSDFLANMSHEIRTPMNAILGMAHLALRSGLTPQQYNYIEKVERSAQSLLGLINDILDFSKIEAGKLTVENVEFRLGDVLEQLANMVRLPAETKGLELVFAIDPEVPRSLVGDALRLGQVLTNLGNNAVKFTHDGEVMFSVDVLERGATDVLIRFSVRDTGVGMAPDHLERLFTPFEQADNSTSRRFGGTGLGLAISRYLVELMGGSISVESTLGAGSTFRFSARLGLPARAANGTNNGNGARHRLDGLRLLVIDDNASSRAALAATAAAFGMRVDVAEDGWDAMRATTLAAQRQEPFRLVLVDAGMPGMDGLACARQLLRARGAAPLLLMTATAKERDEVTAGLKALGVEAPVVLTKPVSPSSLLDACLTALGAEPPTASRAAALDDSLGATLDQLRGARVLLVEDNAINRELAVELLSDAGISVTVTGNGREALEALERERFDGVLMDCQMPVMDGYEATRAIRLRPGGEALPVIAMTANAMAGDRDRALAAGMNDHIAKPIQVDAMFRTIARWVRPGVSHRLARLAVPQASSPPASPPYSPPSPVVSAPASALASPPASSVASRPGSLPAASFAPTPASPPAATRLAPDAGAAELPASLPGIDMAVGRATTMGDARLQRRLLVLYCRHQADAAGAIRAARAGGDHGQALRIAHDLGSSSASLGMHAVAENARAIEAAFNAGSEAAEIDGLLDELATRLGPVIAELRAAGLAPGA